MRFFIFLFVFLIVSCQTVRIRPTGKTLAPSHSPDYERTHNFFIFGLIRESFVDIQSLCQNKPVQQMQVQFNPLDIFWASLSLGIYSPKTVSVWCEGGSGKMDLDENPPQEPEKEPL